MPTRFGLPHHGSLYTQQAVKCLKSSQKRKWYMPTGFPQVIYSGGPGSVRNAMIIPIIISFPHTYLQNKHIEEYSKTSTMEALPGNCITLNFGAK